MYHLYDMEGEFNNINTDNIKTTFIDSPNNVQQSDELEADYLYYRKMGTAYSAGKKVKTIIVGISVTMTAGAGVALSVNLINTSFIAAPTISNIVIASNDATSIDYSFNLEKNERKYTMIFTLKDVGTEVDVFSLKLDELKSYTGKIENLNPVTTYRYSFIYSNNVDLTRTLSSGEVITK